MLFICFTAVKDPHGYILKLKRNKNLTKLNKIGIIFKRQLKAGADVSKQIVFNEGEKKEKQMNI